MDGSDGEWHSRKGYLFLVLGCAGEKDRPGIGLEDREASQLMPESWPPVGEGCEAVRGKVYEDEDCEECGDEGSPGGEVDTASSCDIMTTTTMTTGRTVRSLRDDDEE